MSCNPSTVTVTRGASFLVLAHIPDDFPDGHFASHTIKSQLRSLNGGLIAELNAERDDPATTRILKLSYTDTSGWPLNMAQFDVILTSPQGLRTYTGPAAVVVTPGVTEALP